MSLFEFYSFKVTVPLQTHHFVEILIFRLMYRSKHELSSKKILKNIKYWQRNGGFKFWPEVKLPVWLTYLALFSRINFFTWCRHILTVGRLTHKQQNRVCKFFLSKYFTIRAIFVRTLHIFLILFRKCSVTFHWNWLWQIADVFLALWPRKQRNILNKRKTKFALTCNV